MLPTLDEDIKGYLRGLCKGQILSSKQISVFLDKLCSSSATSDQRAAFLMALSLRGESEEELLGATEFLRSRMISIPISEESVDIVGTGGDGYNTYNISTTSAFVAAGAGAKVVKHGNRSASSRSGATDVLSSLKIKIDLPVDKTLKIYNEIGLCFLWAQTHHPILKTWSKTRSDLGIRSIFNLVGPLCNPGKVKRQVIGVGDPKWMLPFANVLMALGSLHVWIVCGYEGLDELSTTGPTQVIELKNGSISNFELNAENLGFKRGELSELVGGDPQSNAEELKAILMGKHSAYRDTVLLNAAALLIVAGITPTIQKGIELASNSIDKGLALEKLNSLIKYTNNI